MTLPLLAWLLFLANPNSHAECVETSRMLNFKIPTVEAISKVGRSSVSIPVVGGPSFDPRNPQNIVLKDPYCISQAISSIDTSRYVVLYVWAFVRGLSCGEDDFKRYPNPVHLVLEIGDKLTPWPNRLNNTFNHDIIFYFSESNLNRHQEDFECASE